MKVQYSPMAFKTLRRIADYVESINTEGSGDRWAAKFVDFIISSAKPNTTYAKCQHPTLLKFNYQCLSYNDWIIAFRIKGDIFEVRRILYGPRLH